MKTPHNGWLITGGTGFLAQALVRRLLRDHDDPNTALRAQVEGSNARICVYSRGEAAQARMHAELKDDERLRWFVGDVRDRERLRRAMESVVTVVHAAALKRVEVGEYNPTEMVKTNIIGTMNVIEAAIDAGVHCVVLVSSDKAVEPLNCYGATKLVAEKLFKGASLLAPYGPKFIVVRYGNVAGSTGSVIPTWRAQLAAGISPIVRKLDATRFWLTVDQAVDFVLQACEWPTGAVYVPELPAYMVGDLLAAMYDTPSFAVVTDDHLGPGEKLHESLLAADEPGGPRRSCDARRMSVVELREAIAKL